VRIAIKSVLFAAVAVAVAVSVFASCAFAAPPVEKMESVGRVQVSYHDLDLQKEADARVLLKRLERAAYRACGGNPKLYLSYRVIPDRTVEVFKECREEAVARAVAAVHSVTLERLADDGRGADRPAARESAVSRR
jgi:UrcA family protein